MLGSVAGGCATATGLNRAVPPLAKVVQDSSQVATTSAAAGASMPTSGVEPEDKPTFVPEARDPVAYSRADNLFWNDIMMEHAQFFTTMLPGDDLAAERRQAEEFQRTFAELERHSGAITRENYRQVNARSIDMARRFSDWKKTMEERQKSGKIHSLVFPLFFHHTAREADRYAMRLDQFNRGTVELDRREVVQFWSATMGEHSGFISHLVDPTELELRRQANEFEKTLLRQGAHGPDFLRVANGVVELHIASERGVHEGRIKSIIHPALASHVRREAVRFIDELRRT